MGGFTDITDQTKKANINVYRLLKNTLYRLSTQCNKLYEWPRNMEAYW